MTKAKEKEEKKERVTIFGRPEAYWDREWGHTGEGTWGFVLIAAGVLLLLNTVGALSWSVWDQVWRFWPLLLVLWGIQIILGNNFFGRGIANIIGFLFVALVALFAVHQVDPNLVSGLPPVFDQIFAAMEGVQK